MLPGVIQFFAARKAAPPLPYDAEVAYIGVLAGQAASLGVIPTIDTMFKTKAAFVSDNGNLHFGFKGGEYSSYRIFYSAKLYFDLGNYRNQGGRCIAELAKNTAYELEFGNNYIKADGVEVARQTESSTALDQQEFLIGGGGAVNVYSARLETGGTTLDLIPVRFTNELGQSEGAFYDTISKRLFRKTAGSGQFAIGPDKGI